MLDDTTNTIPLIAIEARGHMDWKSYRISQIAEIGLKLILFNK